MKEPSYTADDIKVLTDRDHVRIRTALYLGNMQTVSYRVPLFLNDMFIIKELEFIPAVYKSCGEILDNCIDEFSQISKDAKKLIIEAKPETGEYIISDNGRGVPIDKHETGKYTPEVVFSQLRSGRNFKEGKEAGVIGMNGVGSSAVAYVSEEFNIEINRDGKKYKQTFSDGAKVIKKPNITSTGSTKTGTSIGFKLDGQVFKNVSLPEELMNNRAIELALTNPNITIEYNSQSYKFKKGFDDIIKKISTSYFQFQTDNMEFFVIFDINKNNEDDIFTWVNSSLLFDGGVCNTQFINAFSEKVMEHLEKDAKKNKCKIEKNDIKRKLLIIGNLKIKDPQYDSQAKTRLTGPLMKKEFVQLIENQWGSFSRKNKEWLETVLDYAKRRHHFEEDNKAVKDLKNNSRKKIASLLDATSDNYYERQLLITEGDSAKASISEARNSKTTAAFPLTGKINNVYGIKVSELLQMGKITDLLTIIGLIPGQKATRSSLNYGKIVIASDADHDGSHIYCLLINIFYQFWPELFDPNYQPIVYRLLTPNVCLVKGDKRIHFTNRTDYENNKDKYSGYSVNYFKGLGSMDKKDWIMVLNDEKYLLPIVDDGKMTNTLTLLFSKDTGARQEWLQK